MVHSELLLGGYNMKSVVHMRGEMVMHDVRLLSRRLQQLATDANKLVRPRWKCMAL
jgi:hypothetical protein